MTEVIEQTTAEAVAEVAGQSQYVTVLEKYSTLIQEVTGCTEEQAVHVGELTSALIGEAVDYIMNDQSTLQSIFTNMLRTQLNNTTRLDNILAAQSRREFAVVDEAHPVADIRVTYVGETADTWTFDQVAAGGWEPLQVDPQTRMHLEVLVGKFFNGRVGHVGYIVEIGALQQYEASHAAPAEAAAE